MRITKEKHPTTGLPASEELRFKRSQSSHVIWAATLPPPPHPAIKTTACRLFLILLPSFSTFFFLPPCFPFPSKELKKTVWSYLQLWSSWLWESRWSWPSSPVLKSSGVGQRNTGIFSSSHKSPLCIPAAPRSWAWCPGDGCTVPEASEINEPRKHSH